MVCPGTQVSASSAVPVTATAEIVVDGKAQNTMEAAQLRRSADFSDGLGKTGRELAALKI